MEIMIASKLIAITGSEIKNSVFMRQNLLRAVVVDSFVSGNTQNGEE